MGEHAHPHPTGGALRRATRAEIAKIQSFRGVRVLFLVHVAAFALFALVKATSAPEDGGTTGLGASIVAGADSTPLLFAIVGLIVFSGESSRGSIAYTLLGTPRRLTVLLAKASAITLLSVVAAVASIVAAAVVVGVVTVASGSAPVIDLVPDLAFLGSFLVLAVLYALLGLGVGALVPGTAGAVFVLLGVLWGLPLVGAVVGIWVPMLGSLSLTYSPAVLTVAMAAPAQGWIADFGVFLLWVGVLLAAGWLRFRTFTPR